MTAFNNAPLTRFDSLPPPPLAVLGFVQIAELYNVIDCNGPPLLCQPVAISILLETAWQDGAAFPDNHHASLWNVQECPVGEMNAEGSEWFAVQSVENVGRAHNPVPAELMNDHIPLQPGLQLVRYNKGRHRCRETGT